MFHPGSGLCSQACYILTLGSLRLFSQALTLPYACVKPVEEYVTGVTFTSQASGEGFCGSWGRKVNKSGELIALSDWFRTVTLFGRRCESGTRGDIPPEWGTVARIQQQLSAVRWTVCFPSIHASSLGAHYGSDLCTGPTAASQLATADIFWVPDGRERPPFPFRFHEPHAGYINNTEYRLSS